MQQQKNACACASWGQTMSKTPFRDAIEAEIREDGATRGHRRFLRAKLYSKHAEAMAAEDAARRPAPRLCGAKTRRGLPCIRRARDNGRCPNHGGQSTGPKTSEGRQRISEAQRQRWARWRQNKSLATKAIFVENKAVEVAS